MEHIVCLFYHDWEWPTRSLIPSHPKTTTRYDYRPLVGELDVGGHVGLGHVGRAAVGQRAHEGPLARVDPLVRLQALPNL